MSICSIIYFFCSVSSADKIIPPTLSVKSVGGTGIKKCPYFRYNFYRLLFRHEPHIISSLEIGFPQKIQRSLSGEFLQDFSGIFCLNFSFCFCSLSIICSYFERRLLCNTLKIIIRRNPPATKPAIKNRKLSNFLCFTPFLWSVLRTHRLLLPIQCR